MSYLIRKYNFKLFTRHYSCLWNCLVLYLIDSFIMCILGFDMKNITQGLQRCWCSICKLHKTNLHKLRQQQYHSFHFERHSVIKCLQYFVYMLGRDINLNFEVL